MIMDNVKFEPKPERILEVNTSKQAIITKTQELDILRHELKNKGALQFLNDDFLTQSGNIICENLQHLIYKQPTSS